MPIILFPPDLKIENFYALFGRTLYDSPAFPLVCHALQRFLRKNFKPLLSTFHKEGHIVVVHVDDLYSQRHDHSDSLWFLFEDRNILMALHNLFIICVSINKEVNWHIDSSLSSLKGKIKF